MLDIKLIRSNPELVKAAAKKREYDADQTIDDILKIDAQRREVTGSGRRRFRSYGRNERPVRKN